MPSENPFNRNEVMVLGFLHFGLIAGVGVFLAVVMGLNQSQAHGKVAEIPDYIRILTFVAVVAPVAALYASRIAFQRLFSGAFARHAGGDLSAQDLKRSITSAYIIKAAVQEAPAMIGIVALLLIALLPCDILLAPRFYLLNLVGPALFIIEMAVFLPTWDRLDFSIRSLGEITREGFSGHNAG